MVVCRREPVSLLRWCGIEYGRGQELSVGLECNQLDELVRKLEWTGCESGAGRMCGIRG
jgi:hypothetical protein